MVNTKKLQGKMRENGYTTESLATAVGLTVNGFFNKLHGKTEFKASEIMRLNTLLSLSAVDTDEIFFAKDVE